MIGFVLSAVLGRLQALWGIFARYPLQGIILALVALCGVQTWRLSGVKHDLTAARAQIVAMETASRAAAKAQADMRASEAKRYKDQAHEADAQHRAALAGARSDTARFIAANRVRPNDNQRAPVAIGQSGDAGQPESVPPPAVMVAEPDVQSCGDWQAYGVAAHDFLLTITK